MLSYLYITFVLLEQEDMRRKEWNKLKTYDFFGCRANFLRAWELNGQMWFTHVIKHSQGAQQTQQTKYARNYINPSITYITYPVQKCESNNDFARQMPKWIQRFRFVLFDRSLIVVLFGRPKGLPWLSLLDISPCYVMWVFWHKWQMLTWLNFEWHFKRVFNQRPVH